jgi:hypothetical protein
MPYWFDGNSVLGQSSRKMREDRETRRAFLQHLGERTRSRGGRYLVFFDGDDPDRSLPPRGIQVRYCAPHSADGAILRGLRSVQKPAEVIVVSNDHALSRQCHSAGAQVMTWKQFDIESGRRSPEHRNKSAGEEEIKIEEWVDYFGLDSETLK